MREKDTTKKRKKTNKHGNLTFQSVDLHIESNLHQKNTQGSGKEYDENYVN